jgi:hypothetical protein
MDKSLTLSEFRLHWRWQPLCNGVVFLQGIAITRATAVAQVAHEISDMCSATGGTRNSFKQDNYKS